MIKEFLYVALGGALGSALRYGVTILVSILSSSSILATFTANILGSFLIGVVMTVFAQEHYFYLLGAIGFCGGFTTFSTFSAQTLQFFQTGQIVYGVSYIFVSVLLCVLAVLLGLVVGNYRF